MSSTASHPSNEDPHSAAAEPAENGPVVEPEEDDGYEADDEGPDGWPEGAVEEEEEEEQDDDDDDKMSIITHEDDEEEQDIN